MSKFKKEFELLTGLGLTSRQTKIYLALTQSEIATAKTISNSSGVRRENVYRIIPQLQQIGLIEKIIDTPIKFKAIEIKDAVLILLDRRIKRTNKLQKAAKIVIKNSKKMYTHNNTNEEKTEFILIPKKLALLHRKIQSINNAKTSIDIITTLKRLFQAGPYFIPLNKALERNVTIRIITEKPQKRLELPINRKSTQTIKKNYHKILRYSKQPIKNVILIIDTKEVYIFIAPHLRAEESPALWSNNPSLIDITKNYFEKTWNESPETKNTNNPNHNNSPPSHLDR